MIDDYEIFISSLKIYKQLKRKSERLAKLIEKEWDELVGVKGVDPSKEPNHNTNQQYLNEIFLERLEYVNDLEESKRNIDYQIQSIDERLEEMNDDIKYIFVEKYINKKSFEKLSRELHISIGGLQSKMRSEFKRG